MTSELLGHGNDHSKYKVPMNSPPKYLQDIKNFDVTSLDKKQIKLLKESKGDPELEPKNVEKVS